MTRGRIVVRGVLLRESVVHAPVVRTTLPAELHPQHVVIGATADRDDAKGRLRVADLHDLAGRHRRRLAPVDDDHGAVALGTHEELDPRALRHDQGTIRERVRADRHEDEGVERRLDERPPAESACAVLPLAVATIRPSPATVIGLGPSMRTSISTMRPRTRRPITTSFNPKPRSRATPPAR